MGFFLGTCVSGNGIGTASSRNLQVSHSHSVKFFDREADSLPPLAPLTGGIISAYTSWRVIFGVQAGMTLAGLVLGWFFVPHDIVVEAANQPPEKPTKRRLLQVFSPLPVFKVMRHPNILLAVRPLPLERSMKRPRNPSCSPFIQVLLMPISQNIACGLLAFNQYGMLSAIRPAVNARFNLSTPLTSGLFYIAPGVGFVLGGTIGGRIADHTVKRYIKKRDGIRLPRDRLRSGFVSLFLILPLGTLLMGWSLQKHLGGMVLPAASAFVAGVGLMSSFSGLNTFSAGMFMDFPVLTASPVSPCSTNVIRDVCSLESWR